LKTPEGDPYNSPNRPLQRKQDERTLKMQEFGEKGAFAE
jgi:hypothetical protein